MAPVIPVIVVDDLSHARPLAEALVAGGLPVLEVTLRTDCALDAIAAMAEVPGAVVGAGTVLTAAQMKAVKDAGARFAVSPGATAALLDAARVEELALLPGAQTCSEVMALLEQGYHVQKILSGGIHRRGGGAEIHRRTVATGHVLPHGRDHAGTGAGLSGATQRCLCGWVLGGPPKP